MKLRFQFRTLSQTKGQSLVELIIGISIGALIIGSAVGAFVLTLRSNLQSRTIQTANSLGQELLDNMKNVSAGRWQKLYNVAIKGSDTTYFLISPLTLTGTVAVTNGLPDVAGSGTSFNSQLIVGDYIKIKGEVFKIAAITSDISLTLTSSYQGITESGITAYRDFSVRSGTEEVAVNNIAYTRSFAVENVTRDSSGNIGAGTNDPSTQKVTMKVNWQVAGTSAEIKIPEYLTRIRNEVSRFTDWSGTAGVEGPVTQPSGNYSSQTGLDLSAPGAAKLAP